MFTFTFNCYDTIANIVLFVLAYILRCQNAKVLLIVINTFKNWTFKSHLKIANSLANKKQQLSKVNSRCQTYVMSGPLTVHFS